MEFEGVVYRILPPTSGTSARGEWKRQEVVFELPQEFSRKICVTFFNKESDVAQSVDADSAYAKLRFECDSLGNVLLVALEQEQGKRTSLELQLKDNILKIQAIQEEFEIIVKGLKRDKEVLIKENTELKEKLSSVQSQEKQEPVIVEKPIPDIVKWLAWIGGAAILYMVLRFALWIYKKVHLK